MNRHELIVSGQNCHPYSHVVKLPRDYIIRAVARTHPPPPEIVPSVLPLLLIVKKSWPLISVFVHGDQITEFGAQWCFSFFSTTYGEGGDSVTDYSLGGRHIKYFWPTGGP